MAVFDAEIIHKKNQEWRKDHRNESNSPTIVESLPSEEIDIDQSKRQKRDARSLDICTNQAVLTSKETQKVSSEDFVFNS